VNDQPQPVDSPIPLVLRLLDHQIVGPEGDLLGNVDDLQLQRRGTEVLVTGLLSGPVGLSGRQGGRAGDWLLGGWTRLHPDGDPRPLVIPLSHVTELGSAVRVGTVAAEALATSAGFELWLRQKVVSRLPGALGERDQRAEARSARTRRERHPEFEASGSGERLSALLGRPVVDAGGRDVGRVVEVMAVPFERSGLELGRMRLVEVVCSRSRVGEELGYTLEPQGPWILSQLMRWLHRHDVRIPIEALLDLAQDAEHWQLRADAAPRHPYEV
jgi:sporulation protein YlmC with PRC-barrel domain